MKHRKKRGASQIDDRRFIKRGKRGRKNEERSKRKGKRHRNGRARTFPQIFVFFSIVNGDVCMDQGTTAALIASSLITLHGNLDADKLNAEYIDKWTRSGARIVILKGCDHTHLKYLEEEVKHVAIDTQAVCQRWGRGRYILVLSAFGEKEELEEVFQGLAHLR